MLSAQTEVERLTWAWTAERIEERVLLPDVCNAEVAAPVGRGKEAAETACVAGKLLTDTLGLLLMLTEGVPEIVAVTDPETGCVTDDPSTFIAVVLPP